VVRQANFVAAWEPSDPLTFFHSLNEPPLLVGLPFRAPLTTSPLLVCAPLPFPWATQPPPSGAAFRGVGSRVPVCLLFFFSGFVSLKLTGFFPVLNFIFSQPRRRFRFFYGDKQHCPLWSHFFRSLEEVFKNPNFRRRCFFGFRVV